MRAISTLVVLAVFILATSVTVAQGPPAHSQGVQKLKDDTNGKAKIRVDKKSGEAKFVQLPADSLPSSTITNKAAKSAERAKAFVRQYGNAFGVDKPDAELTVVKTERDSMGVEHTILRQTYEDVPVFGGELRAHFNSGGDLSAVNGTFVSNIKLNTTPNLTAEQAAGRAIRTVIKQQARKHQASGRADGGNSTFNEADYDDLTAVSKTLMVFREGLLRGTPGADHLAYEIEVRSADFTIREFVFVDAQKGTVIDQFTGIHDALDRRAYDGGGLPGVPPAYPGSPFWVEGDPLPTTEVEADNMIYASGETYDLFFNAFGRDSFDAVGATMDAIFNRGYGCPNASWNGVFISFCAGFTTDDITGHEWGHAYTDYTNNLIYQWQSGALNESYSDIWGETVDLINGRGLDAPGGLRTDGSCSNFGPGGPGDDSVRWIMGEEFAPLRDMWNPTCAGDPGKVTDNEYYCLAGDNGGVHFNSGVPNHAYALMVDGGNFNGYSGAGIGLTKAAHIHWAAQNMLTLSSNFVDHADALDTACNDLATAGTDLLDLITGAPSGEVISAGDCAQVAAISAAVEFRTSVVEQCGFEPILEPVAPALCEGQGSVQTVVLENFDSNSLPAGWTASAHDVANPATFDNPGWSAVDNLPAGNNSLFAAFAPDLNEGDCGADTEAGAVALDSPDIVLPLGAPPHVAFDHWVATETGWDGGNLKVSVNGGSYEVVPSSAYSFNPYNGAINVSDNPLGGEEAFTGADEGSVAGSWGQSQVDLFGVAGALPGDTVKLRYDLGVDGCAGTFGWYVDDVHVYSCSGEELPVCGDGSLDFGEQCDDGNNLDGDGCSASCGVEEGWSCADPVAGASSTNVVADWSFEGGVPNADWTAFSTFGGLDGFPLCGPGNGCPASSLANTGDWLVWIGGLSAGVTSSVEQSITIPAAATELKLQTYRGRCDDANDTLHVSLDGNDIGTVACDATDGGFVEQVFSVAGYNDGGTHTLFIGGTVGGTNGTHSNFFVDDVILSDNTPRQPTPSQCERVVEDLSCNAGPVEFTDGIAASWAVVDNEGTGVVWTDIASSSIGGNFTGGDGEAASVNSDASIFTEYDTELQSNSFSLEHATSAGLHYLANFQNLVPGADFLDVDVSTDGGGSWSNLLSWTEDHGGFFAAPGEASSLDLAAYLGEPDVQVRWHYYNPNFGDWDWYAQVDNVALTCDQTGQMNGGGSFVGEDGTQYSHGFELQCQDGIVPSNLVINWGSGRDKKMFKLTELTTALCSDRPGLDEGSPSVGFDTFTGAGTGTLNKEPVSIMFRITDAGEPGTSDEMEFTISGPEGASVSSVLLQGNHQAVREE